MTKSVVVLAKKLGHYFPRTGLVFEDLDFSVSTGEIVCLLGPSGCGKTTILNILSGVLHPTMGQVLINGNLVAKPDKNIGYCPQLGCLLPWRTAFKNASVGLEIRNSLTNDNVGRIRNLFADFEMNDKMNEMPANLSGGERQRVALIRTLVINPSILLLDEPLSHLDYLTKLYVENLIVRYVRAGQRTECSLYVTHNLDEAIAIADRVVILSKRPSRILELIDLLPLFGDAEPTKRRKMHQFQEAIAKVSANLNTE